MKDLLIKALRYFWLILLGLALSLCAYGSYRRTLSVREYPYGCDSFGYLQMAKNIRIAKHRGELPRFSIDADHTRVLIDFLRSQNLPTSKWDELVAPHAHHYFPQADHVGVQYPPGTGILLASFREGKALQGLNRNVVLIFLVVGALALVIAGVKQTWAVAGCVVFAMEFGLDTLEHIGALSFSINALLAPLLFALIFLCASLRIGATAANPLVAWSLSFLAGLCFGFSVLVRLPVIFLLPGLLLLFIPLSGRPRLKGTAFAFAAGILLCGILPILIHQHRLTGAWYLPTYNSGDNSLPTLEVIQANLDFYLGSGPGSRGLWFLPVAFLGFAGLAVLRRYSKQGIGFGWGRVAGAALLLWGISLVYFLSFASRFLITKSRRPSQPSCSSCSGSSLSNALGASVNLVVRSREKDSRSSCFAWRSCRGS